MYSTIRREHAVIYTASDVESHSVVVVDNKLYNIIIICEAHYIYMRSSMHIHVKERCDAKKFLFFFRIHFAGIASAAARALFTAAVVLLQNKRRFVCMYSEPLHARKIENVMQNENLCCNNEVSGSSPTLCTSYTAVFIHSFRVPVPVV